MGRTAGPRLQSKSGPPAVLRRDAGESLPRLRLVVGDVRPCPIEPAAAVEEGLPHLLTRWAVKSRTPSPPCEGAACARTMSSAASTVYSERHPLDVSSSMQIDPPTVTWPVWKAKRGATTCRDAAEMQPRCSRDAAEMQPRYGSRDHPQEGRRGGEVRAERHLELNRRPHLHSTLPRRFRAGPVDAKAPPSAARGTQRREPRPRPAARSRPARSSRPASAARWTRRAG